VPKTTPAKKLAKPGQTTDGAGGRQTAAIVLPNRGKGRFVYWLGGGLEFERRLLTRKMSLGKNIMCKRFDENSLPTPLCRLGTWTTND